MKLKKLKKAVKDTHGFDMETCSHDLGYKDVMSFLQDIPELLLENCNKVQNCIVQLKSGRIKVAMPSVVVVVVPFGDLGVDVRFSVTVGRDRWEWLLGRVEGRARHGEVRGLGLYASSNL